MPLPKLQHITLERRDGQLMASIQKLLGASNADTVLQLLGFAVYLSSNDVLSNHQTDDILLRIIDNKQRSIFRKFFSTKIPSIESFVTNLL